MILCLCRAVTAADIHDAIDDGADSVDAVGRQCGAGTGCGSCRRVIHRMLEQKGRTCAGGCRDCPRRRGVEAA